LISVSIHCSKSQKRGGVWKHLIVTHLLLLIKYTWFYMTAKIL
jgi:hypothetical protein